MGKKIRHFINLPAIGADTLKGILKHAHALKAEKYNPPQLLEGLSLAMVFDKRSTRTRISFEVAMKQLGGHTVVMGMGEMQIAGSETIEDTSKVLSRFVDAVMLRMSSHENMEELARWATIPVINGMTDQSHPCQIMADLLTIEEKLGGVEGKKIAWFGDYNNVCTTFEQAAPLFGFDLVISTPPDLQPAKLGAHATYIEDAKAAAKDADVIVTDTWVSMGQEGKAIEKFMPYQVNPELMAQAKDGAIFMHCMPIHQNEEVTKDVLNTPASVIYDEAENRLHAQKAILAWCLADAGVRVKKKG
ncbi:MAG: ornithine carbamoyltransferase [Alphaproteobacteria bacterium]|nr:ornithine carbamoyltransferase [Alphaproteobacteria bacterium]MCB9974152.1 ornithine carbamoyltransferase [Rhodospirillales bacterium]